MLHCTSSFLHLSVFISKECLINCSLDQHTPNIWRRKGIHILQSMFNLYMLLIFNQERLVCHHQKSATKSHLNKDRLLEIMSSWQQHSLQGNGDQLTSSCPFAVFFEYRRRRECICRRNNNSQREESRIFHVCITMLRRLHTPCNWSMHSVCIPCDSKGNWKSGLACYCRSPPTMLYLLHLYFLVVSNRVFPLYCERSSLWRWSFIVYDFGRLSVSCSLSLFDAKHSECTGIFSSSLFDSVSVHLLDDASSSS